MSVASSHALLFGLLSLIAVVAVSFEIVSERRRRRHVVDGFMDWRALFPLDDEGEAA